MLENDEVQPESTGGEPPVRLPWDAIDPLEAEVAEQANEPADDQPLEETPSDEIPQPAVAEADEPACAQEQPIEAQAMASEAEADAAQGGDELPDVESEVADAESQIAEAADSDPQPIAVEAATSEREAPLAEAEPTASEPLTPAAEDEILDDTLAVAEAERTTEAAGEMSEIADFESQISDVRSEIIEPSAPEAEIPAAAEPADAVAAADEAVAEADVIVVAAAAEPTSEISDLVSEPSETWSAEAGVSAVAETSDEPAPADEAELAAAVIADETTERESETSDHASEIPAASTAESSPQPAIAEGDSADPANEPLPWSVAASADAEAAPSDLPADPQPPALAYAPAFLAVDEEGLPVPDEVVDELPVEIPSLPPEPLEPEELAVAAAEPVAASGSGLWTIPLMCLGIGIIACCLIIPQADKNRRLMWEQEGLRRNLAQLQQQVEINETFIEALTTDRTLAKRLAQRQLNVVPAGTTILELDGLDSRGTSPFQLVTVPPPPPLPEYQPIGGWLAELCRNPRSQLYLIAAGLFAIGAGMILGRDRPVQTEN